MLLAPHSADRIYNKQRGNTANLRERWVAPVAPVIKRHETAEELERHNPSRPQVAGWVKL